MSKSHQTNKFTRLATKINGIAKTIEAHFYKNKEGKRTSKNMSLYYNYDNKSALKAVELKKIGNKLRKWHQDHLILLHNSNTTEADMTEHHKRGLALVKTAPQFEREKSKRRRSPTEKVDEERAISNIGDRRKVEMTKRTAAVMLEAAETGGYPIFATFTFSDTLTEEKDRGKYAINAMAMKAIHKMSIEAEKDTAQLEGRSPRPDKELKPICLHKPEWGNRTNRLHYHDFWILKTLPDEMKSDPNGLILDPNEWSSKNGWTWNHDKLWKYGRFLIQPVRTGPFDIWESLGFRPVADLIKGPKALDLKEGAAVIAKYLGKESGKAKGNPTINALNAKGNPLIKQHTTANYGRKKIKNAMRELTDEELIYVCDLPNAQILEIWQNLAFYVPTKHDILVEAGKEHRRRFGNLANAIFAENQTRMKFPDHIREIRKKQRDLQHEKQLRADIAITGPMIEQIISKLLKHTCPEMGELKPGVERDLLCTHARTGTAIFKCQWAIKNSQHALGKAGYSNRYRYDDSAAEFGQEILNALECTLAYCEAAYTGLHVPDEQIKRYRPECQTDDYEMADQFKTVTATLSRPDKTDAERGDALDGFIAFLESEIELQSV